MSVQKATLSSAELAVIDALITTAQGKGRSPGDRLDDDDWPRTVTAVEAKMMGGHFQISDADQAILAQISDLTEQLQFRPTLQQLIDLREVGRKPVK